MFGAGSNPAQLYNQVSVDTDVNAASPHRLIELLFEAADDSLVSAQAAIEMEDLARKGEAITRVIRIVDEGLRASLNPQAGELAERLGSLYDYVLRRLLEANRTNSSEILDEIRRLMNEVHDGWSGIAMSPAVNEMAAA
jgi:flagellar protein FliS